MESQAKSRYRIFCHDNSRVPIFAQPWFLDIVSEDTWDVSPAYGKKNKNILGYLPYSFRKRSGIFKTVGLPPITPYTYFVPVQESTPHTYRSRNEYQSLLQSSLQNLSSAVFTRHHFSPDITNAVPLAFEGYSISHRYTFELSDIKDFSEIWQAFQSNVRNHITKMKGEIHVEVSEDIAKFSALVGDVFSRQDRVVPFSLEILSKLDTELKTQNKRVILFAKNNLGEVISGLYLIFDRQKCYCLLTGTRSSARQMHPLSTLYWEGIKFASERAESFTFLGSMVPNIERMFRSFNGKQIPYICAIKAPLLIRILKGL